MMGRKDRKHHETEKVLDVDASMQGTLIFKDPVNLRINGRFEGTLNTKGSLMIGEHAVVNADVTGESIVVAGKVNGNIIALKELKLVSPACVVGDIKTPLLSIAEGAVLEGNSRMLSKARSETAASQNTMTPEELAKYLEVDMALVTEWANSGKLPGTKNGNSWRFDRAKVDEWVATEKIK
ncbi:MAG: polymer-forming cytoskeletal protein [Candidatus Omnitrophica bacterium]|nr:polymer-forming cytoskeletal protein [Candidatus Omnitrophota bacterium]